MGNAHRGAWRVRVFALGACAGVLAACGLFGGSPDRVTIGAVTFAENQIVAEIYAQVLEDAGRDVDRRFNFQRREDLYPELADGRVDLAPEYLASLLIFLESDAVPSPDPDESVDELEPLLSDAGLELLTPSEANDSNAFVVTGETAERYNLSAVSDLAAVAGELTFGGPPECPDRRFCLAGLRDVYGVEFEAFQALDAGGPLTIAALSSGQIDVALMFSTSAIIEERGWVVLEDDKNLQAAENITPLVRSEVVDEEIRELLDEVSALLTTENMTKLNARVEMANEDVSAVAEDFLTIEGLLDE
ncbi:MAG: ABC transporter substrate-binding protein [Actinomycetota bacterium]